MLPTELVGTAAPVAGGGVLAGTAASAVKGADLAYSHVRYLPFSGEVPTRRVVLAWRRSFTRYEAIAALRNAVYACELPGVRRLS